MIDGLYFILDGEFKITQKMEESQSLKEDRAAEKILRKALEKVKGDVNSMNQVKSRSLSVLEKLQGQVSDPVMVRK